jgi:hypothetical protein
MEEIKEINATWLSKKLEEFSLLQKDLASFINVRKEEVSKWKNGITPIGGQSQAALYWFFRCLDLEKKLEK